MFTLKLTLFPSLLHLFFLYQSYFIFILFLFTHSRVETRTKRARAHTSHIAAPGSLEVSNASVQPDVTKLYAVQQCEKVLVSCLLFIITILLFLYVCNDLLTFFFI